MRIYITLYNYLGDSIITNIATNPKDLIEYLDFRDYHWSDDGSMALYFVDIENQCPFNNRDYVDPYYGITYDEESDEYIFWNRGEIVRKLDRDKMNQNYVDDFLKLYSLDE